MKDIKGVIFDFDGTIADSSYVWDKVDRAFFARRNMEIPLDYVENISTMSLQQGAEYTKNKYNLNEKIEDIIAEWNECAIFEYEKNVKLKPYAKDYICYLKENNYKIGLATASDPCFYTPVLKREGIFNHFDAFLDGSVNNIKGKDFPDFYIECANRMGVLPKHCRVYEDIIKGIRSAKLANMEVFGVYNNTNEAMWEEIKNTAHGYIFSFAELIK